MLHVKYDALKLGSSGGANFLTSFQSFVSFPVLQLNDNDNNVGNDGAVIDDDNRRDGDEDNDGNGTVINIYLVLIFGISYTLLHYNPPPNSVS